MIRQASVRQPQYEARSYAAALADSLGVDAITLGEHHRDDFAISAPEIVLATIAGRTKRILLGTAVTVLSSDDPVRVYERFATLNGVSGGRAEVILGRGSFTESFPLFGYNLSDYDTLFAEKLDLFAKLRNEGPVTWSGRHRSSLTDQEVYPNAQHEGGIPVWTGVGGSPHSVLRTVQTLEADRFDLKYSNCTMPDELLMSSIDLYGREVIPWVRELLS